MTGGVCRWKLATVKVFSDMLVDAVRRSIERGMADFVLLQHHRTGEERCYFISTGELLARPVKQLHKRTRLTS